jgi:hypothetical protein
MPDIAITPANLHPSAQAQLQRGPASVAITAGQVVCLNADQTIGLADANGPPPTNLPVGVALCSAGVGQPVTYTAIDPALVLGGTVIAGTVYVLSGTPGGICTPADLAAGMFTSIIGVGNATTMLWLNVLASGMQI